MNNSDVILIAQKEKATNWQYRDGHDKLSPSIDILSESDLPSIGVTLLPQGVTPQRDMVFAKHPFCENVYIEASSYEDYMHENRILGIIRIAHLLGASKAEFEYSIDKFQLRTLDSNNNVEYKVAKIDAKLKQEYQEKCNKYQKRFNEFKGMSMSKDAYQRAEKEAKNFYLYEDPYVNELLQYRNPKFENPVLTHEIIVKISQYLNNKMDAAFTLNIMKCFKLGTKLKTTLEKRTEITYTIKLTFPKE